MYWTNKAAIFAAASTCATDGKPTVATGKLLASKDAEQAWAEWQAQFPEAEVTMRLTTTANGDVATEFTPGSS